MSTTTPGTDVTPEEQTHLHIAKALARLDYALDHGMPWLTARQLEVPASALMILKKQGLVMQRQERYRITGDGSDFLAEVRKIAVDGLMEVVLDMTGDKR